MEDINLRIIERLLEMQDLKYKEFHSKLCPGSLNIIGIQVPKLRKLAKEIINSDKANEWKNFLENTKNEYYEETMLEGLIIGYLKIPFKEKIKYIEKFIPKIDNWAVCDTACSNLKVKQNEKEELWDFLEKYVDSKKEFELRFVVVMWLFHFIDDEYIDKILNQLEDLYNEKYYTKMAIAWLLSIGLIKQEKKTLEFLKRSKLDDFTYNKALQKAIESYRVSDEKKELYRSMKRK